MLQFISANLAPIMFVALLFFLLTGFPVAFGLAATGMFFGFVAIELGLVPANFFGLLPLRIYGIMANDTLLAIPFFTFMGIILERSGMAEDLLETVGQVFGPVRGGVALAVIFVGALLAATTGVVAASVISMGLISLPIMLRYGYNRAIAAGTITASGTLAQIVPPSLVLIIMADQLGRSVGDMYAGALEPALMLIGLYATFIILVAIIKPKWVPALPPEARIYKEPNGSGGYTSLVVLAITCVVVGWLMAHFYDDIVKAVWQRKDIPGDEIVVMSVTASVILAWVLAVLNKFMKLGLLSKLAERVTFVLIPPLALIFLVLGTIFLGIATPTEGGAMGAVGALLMAVSRRRLDKKLMIQALDTTTKLSCFVLFVLVGSTVFALTFQGIDGPEWVKHLFDKVPGEQMGFLIVVNVLIFILGCFIDFFEISFILLPLLKPIAEGLGIDLIWFGVMIAMNLQTSFLTPPFGFALFYLRSVAPAKDYTDKVTGQTIPAFSTSDIYKGSVPYIVIQLSMVITIMLFPQIVTEHVEKAVKIDESTIKLEIPTEQGLPMPGLPIPGEEPKPDDPNAPKTDSSGMPLPPADASADDPAKLLQQKIEDGKVSQPKQ
jgi:TRAP-type mannitol/chloroaromatic compound transport system permease large subunit